MAIEVKFYPNTGMVLIDKVAYTLQMLEKKNDKTKIETSIMRTLRVCCEPGDEDIDNGEDDEMYRLVQSDKFKGDGHSLALINNQDFIFWESQA